MMKNPVGAQVAATPMLQCKRAVAFVQSVGHSASQAQSSVAVVARNSRGVTIPQLE